MNNDEKIRDQVKEYYSKAVTGGSTCGCGCSDISPKGIISSKMGEYSFEELENIPKEAVENSFGCGNPLAFSEFKEGDVVLDLGSGAGIDILLAAKKVGNSGKVIGIDMTPEMITKANENIKKSGFKNVEVRQGIIENMPVDDNSIDWVISNCVINLSPDKEKVFSEIFRVLKNGGKILISDIIAENLPVEIKNIPEIYNSCIGGAISENEYIKFIEKVGLKNINIKSKYIYDFATIKGIILSEMPTNLCCGNIINHNLEKYISMLEGKIASIKIYAEKILLVYKFNSFLFYNVLKNCLVFLCRIK